MTMFCSWPREVRELHSVANLGDQDECEEHARHRARPAEDPDPAEHDRRHDVQQRSLRRVGPCRAEVADVHEPGDAGHQPGEDEDGHANPRHRDAREAAASRFEPIANR